MTDQPEDDPLRALKEYVASLPKAEQAKKLDDPYELFEMVENGDAVGVFIAVKNGANVEITDENGMTPLHHAAANDMPLIAEALNQEPNQAMWMKDKFARSFIDIHYELGPSVNSSCAERIHFHLLTNSPSRASIQRSTLLTDIDSEIQQMRVTKDIER